MKQTIYKFKDVCDIITDYVANGSFKSLANNVKYRCHKDYARLIRLVDFNNNYDETSAIWVPKSSYEFLKKSILYGNEIIISNVGANLGTVFKCPNLDCHMTLGPNSILVKTNEICNQDYLYYYLKSKIGYNKLLTLVSGSAMPKFNKTDLRNLEISLPNRKYQNKAANILSIIDKKIELNNQINDNLFKQELVLYNKWFVNYNFPDSNSKYKESKLGNIPYNWEVGYFGDNILTKIVKSGVKVFDGEKEYLATADVDRTNINNSSIITYKNRPSRANMTPIKNSIWFAKMENSKKNILVMDYMEDLLNSYIFSTGFMGIECINDSVNYLWCLINDKNFLNIKNNNSTGTLMAGLSNSTTKNIEYVIPDKLTMIKFNEIVDPINKKIYYNNKENKVLEQLRDTLLPKLMNGEIDLENVEI